jgi:hypothetical protein
VSTVAAMTRNQVRDLILTFDYAKLVARRRAILSARGPKVTAVIFSEVLCPPVVSMDDRGRAADFLHDLASEVELGL